MPDENTNQCIEARAKEEVNSEKRAFSNQYRHSLLVYYFPLISPLERCELIGKRYSPSSLDELIKAEKEINSVTFVDMLRMEMRFSLKYIYVTPTAAYHNLTNLSVGFPTDLYDKLKSGAFYPDLVELHHGTDFIPPLLEKSIHPIDASYIRSSKYYYNVKFLNILPGCSLELLFPTDPDGLSFRLENVVPRTSFSKLSDYIARRSFLMTKDNLFSVWPEQSKAEFRFEILSNGLRQVLNSNFSIIPIVVAGILLFLGDLALLLGHHLRALLSRLRRS